MPVTNPTINSINVVDSSYCPAGYVNYVLQVTGTTRFMTTPNALTYCVNTRYSDMLQLSTSIAHSIISINAKAILPEFPPKKYFNNLSKEFQAERRHKIQEYFLYLLTNYGDYAQPHLLQFCSPNKLNIIVCGDSNSHQCLLMETIAHVAKTKLNQLGLFRSSSKKVGVQEIDPEALPIPTDVNKSVDSITLPPFMSKIKAYTQDFPLDYTYKDYLYRIDIEDHTLNEEFHNEHFPNLLCRWSANDNSVIVAANLQSKSSCDKATCIIEAYAKTINKKTHPNFVMVGVREDAHNNCKLSDELKKAMLLPPLVSYPTAYIEVDLKTGDGTMEVLNYLIEQKARNHQCQYFSK